MVPPETIANWIRYGVDEGKDYMILVDHADIYPVFVSEELKNKQIGWYLENGVHIEVYNLQSFREVQLV